MVVVFLDNSLSNLRRIVTGNISRFIQFTVSPTLRSPSPVDFPIICCHVNIITANWLIVFALTMFVLLSRSDGGRIKTIEKCGTSWHEEICLLTNILVFLFNKDTQLGVQKPKEHFILPFRFTIPHRFLLWILLHCDEEDTKSISRVTSMSIFIRPFLPKPLQHSWIWKGLWVMFTRDSETSLPN